MARLHWLLLVIFIAAVVSAGVFTFNSRSASADPGLDPDRLKDLGVAPELTNDVWINSDKPLRLADLRGKVVLLEFWTFGCYNCQNTLGAMKDFHARYADKGLVVIGDHYPEFSYEREIDNVRNAVNAAGIKYAVAIDNDGATWGAYHQRYWPTMTLIDKRGHIRYVAIGEHDYSVTEAAIKALLAE